MKRVLSVLMAGALTVAMAIPALAADTAFVNDEAYNGDGEMIVGAGEDIYNSVTWVVPIDTAVPNKLTVDGVVPNTTFYVPLGAGTTSKIMILDDATTDLFVTSDVLTDTDCFKFKVDKDEGSKYIKKISVVTDKKLDGRPRANFLKVELNESTTVSELKATGTITFDAKEAAAALIADKDIADSVAANNTFTADDKVVIDYNFWINNKEVKGEDGEADTGERVYFKPSSNEDNTMVWGDDRAALFFEGNDDTSKFYARLSTKSDSEIYSTYGDPVNADMWFYDFVGSATIPSTSRATLTLGIPWDDDDDYTPNAEDCFIYEKDADGNLVDVTSKFTFDADNDGTTGIEGWTIKTRTLGTYVISDTELDTTVIDDVDEEPVDDTSSVVDGGKEIPNTGSSDMVGVAVVAAVVSLAAAGAVAFKKASK